MATREQFAIMKLQGDMQYVIAVDGVKTFHSLEAAQKALTSLPDKGAYAIHRREVTDWEKVGTLYTSPDAIHQEGRSGKGRASKGE